MFSVVIKMIAIVRRYITVSPMVLFPVFCVELAISGALVSITFVIVIVIVAVAIITRKTRLFTLIVVRPILFPLGHRFAILEVICDVIYAISPFIRAVRTEATSFIKPPFW
jgi:hypothetical protein